MRPAGVGEAWQGIHETGGHCVGGHPEQPARARFPSGGDRPGGRELVCRAVDDHRNHSRLRGTYHPDHEPRCRRCRHGHHAGLADVPARCGTHECQRRHHADARERSLPAEEIHRGRRRHHRGRAGNREWRRLHRLLGRLRIRDEREHGCGDLEDLPGQDRRSAVRPPESGDHVLGHSSQRRRVRRRRQRQQRRGAVVCAVGQQRRDHVERSHRPRSGGGCLLQLVEPADRHRPGGRAAVRLHRHRQCLRCAARPGPAPEGVPGNPPGGRHHADGPQRTGGRRYLDVADV